MPVLCSAKPMDCSHASIASKKKLESCGIQNEFFLEVEPHQGCIVMAISMKMYELSAKQIT